METKKKVVAYLRVSTGMQVEGYSLDAQLASIERYAKAYDYEIVKIYKDEGKSGKASKTEKILSVCLKILKQRL